MLNFQEQKRATDMWTALIILDHKQPTTPLKTENSTTEGSANSAMKPKRSNTWDMKCHCLIDKEVIDKLRLYWDIGENNGADYFTKHHPPIHHCQIQPRYIHTSNLTRTIYHTIRLCEGVLNRLPGTQSHVNPLKAIRVEPKYINNKCHMVRRSNRPQQYIM